MNRVKTGATPPAIPNPTQPGPYRVRTLFYGSGTDRQRREYRDKVEAAFRTGSVDGSAFLARAQNVNQKYRERYWGFDFRHLPLNGRVHCPVGRGPFPLVLVAHGNQLMEIPAEAGFDYLAERLASRGFVVVTMDHNFLNASLLGGLMEGEIEARAWLTLQHIRQWQEWNEARGHPFYRQVDLDRIGLIGHSRGGEAVALAAVMNRPDRYPGNLVVPLGYRLGIRAVVALAPTDQNRWATPEDIHYLALHGTHDGDMTFFAGMRQYQRVSFSGRVPGFKAAVSIYRANHNRFSTAAGELDVGAPFPLGYLSPLAWVMDPRSLLSGPEQRRIARAFVTAFLAMALQGDQRYRPLFQEPDFAAPWLPETVYRKRIEDHTMRPVHNWDPRPRRRNPRVVQKGTNLRARRVERLLFRNLRRSPQENRALSLRWHYPSLAEALAEGRVATYALHLPPTVLAEGEGWREWALRFSVADARTPPTDPDNALAPLDFTVQLVDQDGMKVGRAVSRFGSLVPPLPVQITVSAWLDRLLYGQPWEVVLQTFTLPLVAFSAPGRRIDPGRLRAIEWVFDRCPEGAILLDDVGFARTLAARPGPGE